MKCPQCHGRTLRVEVVLSGFVACTFSEDGQCESIEPMSLDSELDNESECTCVTCGWKGLSVEIEGTTPGTVVRKAVSQPDPSSSVGTATQIDLETIQKKLESKQCTSSWKRHINSLITEVEQLRAMLELVSRAEAHEARSRRRQAPSDTTLM